MIFTKNRSVFTVDYSTYAMKLQICASLNTQNTNPAGSGRIDVNPNESGRIENCIGLQSLAVTADIEIVFHVRERFEKLEISQLGILECGIWWMNNLIETYYNSKFEWKEKFSTSNSNRDLIGISKPTLPSRTSRHCWLIQLINGLNYTLCWHDASVQNNRSWRNMISNKVGLLRRLCIFE